MKRGGVATYCRRSCNGTVAIGGLIYAVAAKSQQNSINKRE